MILEVINHIYEYDMKNICTVFFPYEKIKSTGEDDIVVTTRQTELCFEVELTIYDKKLKKSCPIPSDSEKAQIAISSLLYEALSDALDYKPPWGILFGVRPAKLMHRFVDEYGVEKTKDIFLNDFLATKSKTQLALDVMKNENRIIALSGKKSFSLYISIPFCPSRCSYCSFVSHSIERTEKLIEPYVDLLCMEIEKTGEIAQELGLNLETIYFGGGTPTTLQPNHLQRLFDTIANSFDLSNLREYTVEAGRPDTITKEKLECLKGNDVTRISINPQSFNDKVLEAIGRKHTVKQTIDAYNLAREIGFDNINMDFIAGLPQDDLASFKFSINKAIDLGAASITVHTLALKSASYMATKEQTFDLTDRIAVSDMVEYSNSRLYEAGYYPYYMYRQSKSLGNLENVGWCKSNSDCLYNVYMMDETHSVFAVGAGAVTRLKNQSTGHIERIYNYKYPYEYINDFEEILNRKNGILSFYKE